MKSLRKFTPLFRLPFISVVLAIGLLLLFNGASVPISAQQSASQPERQVENLIPKHVPLEVKLSKEKEKNWKDLENENWAKDFELEITNTGEKRIYYLQLMLFFDVPTVQRAVWSTAIVYRNPGFKNMRYIATADDVPIKPGESKRFRLHRGNVVDWDRLHLEQHLRLPTKVRIVFIALSFGDGTGLVGEPGAPYPPVQQEEVSR